MSGNGCWLNDTGAGIIRHFRTVLLTNYSSISLSEEVTEIYEDIRVSFFDVVGVINPSFDLNDILKQ